MRGIWRRAHAGSLYWDRSVGQDATPPAPPGRRPRCAGLGLAAARRGLDGAPAACATARDRPRGAGVSRFCSSGGGGWPAELPPLLAAPLRCAVGAPGWYTGTGHTEAQYWRGCKGARASAAPICAPSVPACNFRGQGAAADFGGIPGRAGAATLGETL